MPNEYYGYGETLDAGKGSRRDVRYIAYTTKATFIRTLDDGLRGTRHWIRQRLGRTGNVHEINLMRRHTGRMVTYDVRTYEIVRVRPLIEANAVCKPADCLSCQASRTCTRIYQKDEVIKV